MCSGCVALLYKYASDRVQLCMVRRCSSASGALSSPLVKGLVRNVLRASSTHGGARHLLQLGLTQTAPFSGVSELKTACDHDNVEALYDHLANHIAIEGTC